MSWVWAQARASIEQPHRPGADEHAGEGVNQVVGFHHDSLPTEEAEHLSRVETVPPGREDERLQQGPGPALLENQAAAATGRALVPLPGEQGYPVGRPVQCLHREDPSSPGLRPKSDPKPAAQQESSRSQWE